MTMTNLDGRDLKEIFAGGCANLRLNSKRIDELNVFPIPDGDTGNNMLMTIEGAVKATANEDIVNAEEFMKKFSRGALLGARGNSGVILSQFIKGFYLGCQGVETLGTEDFTKALQAGVEKAYSAVITPTEGTILTVMREGCEFIAGEQGISDFSDYMARLNKRMDESLEHTPELLPILKESGVIDSGGAGFICIFRGMESVINGEEVAAGDIPGMANASQAVDAGSFNADSVLEFGYCTEFILQLQNCKINIAEFKLQEIIDFLESIGNSIVAVQDEDLVKVHVHTFTPGKVLDFGQKYGEFITLKIENMSVQHSENSMFRENARDSAPTKIKKPAVHKTVAVVAVVNGPGLKDFFEELGVDKCVDGGQTENPSTEDFLKGFDELDADDIIVLPCNSNIVMAASQAAELYTKARVHVVKAKTIAEGYSAISMMNLSDGDVDRIVDEMLDCIASTKTGLITTSIRDVEYENITVTKGHYIGLDREHIISDSETRLEAVRGLLEGTEDIKDKEVITIFYGANVPESELSELESLLGQDFPWLESGIMSGGQEVYDYIFAIE